MHFLCWSNPSIVRIYLTVVVPDRDELAVLRWIAIVGLDCISVLELPSRAARRRGRLQHRFTNCMSLATAPLPQHTP